MTIWKFPIEINDRVTIEVPDGSRALSVQVQGGQVCLWMLVDPDQPKVPHHFDIYGTGHPVPDDMGCFVGTVQLQGGALVFHVFETPPPQSDDDQPF